MTSASDSRDTSDLSSTMGWAGQSAACSPRGRLSDRVGRRENAAGPADTELIGDETLVASRIRELAEAGATDLLAMPFGSPEERLRTKELLAGLMVPVG